MKTSEPLKIFIGFDPREQDAFLVARESLRRHASVAVDVRPIVLEHCRWSGMYRREHDVRDGRLWDVLSNAPMSTEFALTRFLTPQLAGWQGWALFMDCDVLVRGDIAELFARADPAFAVQVVQHDHRPKEALKMDEQIQLDYERKNWSSVVLWNCAHSAHRQLKGGIVDRWPGLRLQQFRWLISTQIGALPECWNWLEGHSLLDAEPKIVHYTRGGPWLPAWEDVPFADEWRAVHASAHGKTETVCAPANFATA